MKLQNLKRKAFKGMLTNISCISYAVGGCVPNTILDLAKLDPDLFLMAFGRVGDDEYGKYVIEQMRKHGADTKNIVISKKGRSYKRRGEEKNLSFRC